MGYGSTGPRGCTTATSDVRKVPGTFHAARNYSPGMGAKAAVADRITGCLLGGAIGDALGAGIEFDSIAAIRSRHGRDGVTGYVEAYGRRGAITDDTQLSLFTTEGIIRASVRGRLRGICHPPSVVRLAYLRWYHTQGQPWPADLPKGPDGWLVEVAGLHHRRAPGTTCLGALGSGAHGEPARPINDSKGCGGVMRAAPAGFPATTTAKRFEFGCEIAALTHGHPCGYLPAGFLAATVGALVDEIDLTSALDGAEAVLQQWPHHDETLAAVRAGRRLASAGAPSPEAIERLGGGWVGEEALAIAIACAASATSFTDALLRAVNHSGDSDSTGSITGNLLGAAASTAVLPEPWLADLELRDVITRLGADAARELRDEPPADGSADGDLWFVRYPGW